MRDRIIITITDMDGTTHFNVHQIIKKVLLVLILFIISTFAIGMIIIQVLLHDVDELEQKKNSLHQTNLEYEDNIGNLNHKIVQKELELDSLSGSLEDIEKLMGLKEDESLSLLERVDLAKISLNQKQHMLRSIPNGSPLETTRITDKFGWRNHPIDKKRVFHKGIDLKAGNNTEVFAVADGIVEYAGYHKRSGFGNLLIIIHNYGFKSYYAHLNKIKVKSGDIIHKGQGIALSGNTGKSSGPHLHYEVRYLGVSIDPSSFIEWDLKHYDSIFTSTKGIKWQSLVNMIAINQLNPEKTEPQLSPVEPR